jgi:hypothetical protein
MSNAIIPSKKPEGLAWIGSRLETWADAPASIGLAAPDVASLQELFDSAEADLTAQETAANKARSATLTSNNTFSAARFQAQECLDKIRVFARASSDPDAVYAAADVPPPAKPSAQVPGKPVQFKATLDTSGSLKITWKADSKNPAGTVWIVRRAIGNGGFSQVGLVGGRSFEDFTIPSGSSSVTYVVQGQRGQAVGTASNGFQVRFGTGGGELAIVSQETVKAAA